MFRVYWSECGESRSVTFGDDHMGDALDACEALRERKRNGDDVSFVVICSEVPGDVTKAGVAPAPPGYEWKKRRI